jgi:hypothetical protein
VLNQSKLAKKYLNKMCCKVIAVYHICMTYMSTSIGDVTNTCNSSFVLKVSECCLYSGYCENIAFIADFEDRDVQFFQRVSILLLFLTDYHYRDIIFNFRISFLSMSTNGYLRKVLLTVSKPFFMLFDFSECMQTRCQA